MRKGQQLENYINSLIKCYALSGYHGHKNNALRTNSGIPVKGEPFDYELFLRNAIHLFDAKECSSVYCRWNISAVYSPESALARQFQALTQCTKASPVIHAYFLVWFRASREYTPHLVQFPVAQMAEYINQHKTILTPEDGMLWELGNIYKGGIL